MQSGTEDTLSPPQVTGNHGTDLDNPDLLVELNIINVSYDSVSQILGKDWSAIDMPI